MKRIAILTVILLALALGAGFALRRRPSGTLLEGPAHAFALAPAAKGWRLSFNDAEIPLRGLRFLPPRQEGILVAQAQTQSDRQLVAVFRDGALAADFMVGRPQGAGEGFWRFARLQDAYALPDGTLLLLYRPGDPASTEPSLLLATDPRPGEAKWVHRGAFDRMAVWAGNDPSVLLYGGPGPIARLPLAGARRPTPRTIEVPAELGAIEDLAATGPATFLAAAPGTLWAFLGAKGWTSYPSPADPAVPCEGWRGSLAQAGRKVYWQPSPGRVVHVAQDGSLVADLEPTGMPGDDPQARDLRLARLLGADASGRLWFSLAQPLPQPAAPADAPDGAGDWAAYAAQGLDRIYRWSPEKGTLERFAWGQAWSVLAPPQGVQPAPPVLRPQAGACVLEGQGCAWWLPLSALPFQALQAR